MPDLFAILGKGDEEPPAEDMSRQELAQRVELDRFLEGWREHPEDKGKMLRALNALIRLYMEDG
jgi:hypothetical protein